MKLALFGYDAESLELAAAAVKLGHSIDWCGDAVSARQNGPPWLPKEDLGDQWEALLDRAVCDGVIVGRGDTLSNLRAEQVSQLVKNGVAVLTTFPLVDSVLAYHEIDMSRSEGAGVLHHYNPLVVQSSFIDQCRKWICDRHPELGKVEQLAWERPLSVRTRDVVLWHFARDVELLACISGGLNRLGALGSPDAEVTYSSLSVQMLGPQSLPVVWSVGPADLLEGTHLRIVFQHGKVAARFDASSHFERLDDHGADQVQSSALVPVAPATEAIQRFVSALQSGDLGSSTWPAALRAMELADTIEISLRRCRMIDVHHQQLTEQLSFRGTMSAVGCGVLLILPPLLLVCGWLAEQLGLSVARYWPHLLLASLIFFLALQVLTKLFLQSDGDDSRLDANRSSMGQRP